MSKKESRAPQHGAQEAATSTDVVEPVVTAEETAGTRNAVEANIIERDNQNELQNSSNGRNEAKAANLPLFSGEPKTMGIGEWLKRWASYAGASGMSSGVEPRKLLSFTTGKAFQALTKLPPHATAEVMKETLQKVFGNTPERAFQKLCSNKFELGTDDTDLYGTTISDLVDGCFGDAPITKDRLCKLFFWNGMPQQQESRNLYMMQKMAHRQSDSFETVLDLCRGSFLNDASEALDFAHANFHAENPTNHRPAKGRGKGKGKGKGYFPNKSIHKSAPSTNVRIGQGPKCYKCGGIGHMAVICPSTDPQKVCRNPGYILISNLVREDRFNEEKRFLVDTGSSVTICTSPKNLCRDISETVRINTLGGVVEMQSAKNVTLGGIKMKRVLISEHPITIGDTECHGILGMDWLSQAGSFHVNFGNGFPEIVFDKLGLTPFVGVHLGGDDRIGTILDATGTGHDTLIEKDDFILKRMKLHDASYRWQVEWKWVNGKEPQTKRLPPHYGMSNLSVVEREIIDKELSDLKEKYSEKVEWSKVKATAPIMPRRQLHKTTPIRIVLDLTWLNDKIVTVPNPERPPIGAPEYVRKWRARPKTKVFMVDIRKAYLNIEMEYECSHWQCIRFPDDENVYRLKRLPFGLNIANKVLRTVLEEILPKDVLIDKFVDDLYIPEHLIDEVRSILSLNNFPTKEPEELSDTRVLGIQNSKGLWGRKEPVPSQIESMTKRGISSYTGSIIGIYPVAKWLRPACAYIKRRCELDWDEPIDEELIEVCKKFVADVNARGNVIHGTWFYDADAQWTIWTDASDIARGCVLQIGDVIVEDTTHLRKKADRKHINVAELQAIQDGVELAIAYVKALQLNREIKLTVMCDNTSAIAWLKQSKDRKWKAIKGLSAKLVERILSQIAELCKMYNVKLDIQYVPSEQNLADEMSRVPEYMIQKVEFDSTTIEEIVMAIQTADTGTSDQIRDEYNRLIVNETELTELLTGIHEHEGARALYDRTRLIVCHPQLRQRCQEFVRACAVCQLSKHNTTLSPILEDDKHVGMDPTRPFEMVHMDILGPFTETDGEDAMFVVTLVCRFSRFAITVPTFRCPTSDDTAKTFGLVLARFHTSPDVLMVDGGSQFRALFSAAITDHRTRIVMTSVSSSFRETH